MLVALNGAWKIPIGYFPVHSLSGSERGQLLKTVLELIHETGVIVRSITFDGAGVNKSMCSALGANFDYYSQDFKPWFEHPITKERVLIFWDPCHMLKLIRNALAEKGPFFHPSSATNQRINWNHFDKLVKRQEKAGLHLANKLNNRHIRYREGIMSVRLATQTLSDSVSKALYLLQEKEPNEFWYVGATAAFCKEMNDSFDILNCRNFYSKNPYQKPINSFNESILRARAEEIIKYIEKLEVDIDKYVEIEKDGVKSIVKKKRKYVRKKKSVKNAENVDVSAVGSVTAKRNYKKKTEVENEGNATDVKNIIDHEEIIAAGGCTTKRKYVRKQKMKENPNTILQDVGNTTESSMENEIAEGSCKTKRKYVRKKSIKENEDTIPQNVENMMQNSMENQEIGAVKSNEKKRKYVKKKDDRTEGNFGEHVFEDKTQQEKNIKNDEENVKELRIIKERIPVLKSERYTGFLGMIICLRNIFELQKYCTTYGMSFLLSYKVLQDHLENFFSAIRSKGGFNDNPTCRQFEAAYKRLLVHAEMVSIDKGNCIWNNVAILNCSSDQKKKDDRVLDLTEDFQLDDLTQEDHDYVSSRWKLDAYNKYAITYIAGFIIHKITQKTSCHCCTMHIVGDEKSAPNSLLITMKNRGGLMYPSEDVVRICTTVEQLFRQNLDKLYRKNFFLLISNLLFRKIGSCAFQTPQMDEHVLSQAFLEDHRTESN